VTLPPRSFTKKGRDGRLRSPAHRKFVAQHLCILWDRKDCARRVDCCHARDVAPRGHGGGKPDDIYCVAMCRKHHRESEKREIAWGVANGISVLALCYEFALASPDRVIRDATRNLFWPVATISTPRD
jgi:hypothetical protein